MNCTGASGCGPGIAFAGVLRIRRLMRLCRVNGLSFKAHYNGNGTVDNPSDGVCEPLNPVKLSSSTVTGIRAGNVW